MSHPADQREELVALLRGELGRRQHHEVTVHLRRCDTCRLALVDVAEVHGALMAAGRLLREDVRGPASQVPGTVGPEGERLPPLRRQRRLPRRLVLAAAAAAVAAVVASVAVVAERDSPRPATPASAVLEPLTGDAAGHLTMTATGGQTRMTISTHGLPAAGSGRFYYAWLLDPGTQKMLPLGVVSPAGASHFEVAADLVRRYHAVDISLQADDGDPRHSATSVLRGAF